METIEDIVLRHSKRGMNILREHMMDDYCRKAAGDILSWKKGKIFITTGFYVGGFAETDGPLGSVVLANAVNTLGYQAVIITDEFCRGFFELENLMVEYMPFGENKDYCEKLLEKHKPVGLVSIERCGENINNDYANMRGISIKEHTAKTDMLFEMTRGHIPSIGVGDGGNEIGMGNVKEIIVKELSLVPCKTLVDRLVIATVSNWGAYGIVAYLEKISKIKGLLPSYETISKYLGEIVALGSVDGVTKEHVCTVDGFAPEIEKEILDELHKKIEKE